ncbi:hypothetical protein Bhyg_02149 [Pseudolycoriella hygida]|uniref:Uncharacterized protein n=1 Tax=Pseudolycoriella hygida TaxID=35572 RepID=A0A9Q0NAS6_9DIPT|nr:hypothetical protein Bhyg_02149 [Pseudolycoriella hygida]
MKEKKSSKDPAPVTLITRNVPNGLKFFISFPSQPTASLGIEGIVAGVLNDTPDTYKYKKSQCIMKNIPESSWPLWETVRIKLFGFFSERFYKNLKFITEGVYLGVYLFSYKNVSMIYCTWTSARFALFKAMVKAPKLMPQSLAEE